MERNWFRKLMLKIDMGFMRCVKLDLGSMIMMMDKEMYKNDLTEYFYTKNIKITITNIQY